MVIVKFLENMKTTRLYQEEVIETTEDFEVEDTFSDFIKQNIFSYSIVDPKSSTNNNVDDVRVLWRVSIRTDEDSYMGER